MPRRSRQKSGPPSCAAMSRKPLWPAVPPPNFSFASPGWRSSSSCDDEDLVRRDGEEPRRPRRPRGRTGSCRSRASAAAGRPRRARCGRGTWPRRRSVAPSREASASANQKPALWRVASCSRPGLPRPTTRRIGVPMALSRSSVPRAINKKARRDARGGPSCRRRRRGLFLLVVLAAALLLFFLAGFLLLARGFGRRRLRCGRRGFGGRRCRRCFFLGFDLRARHDRGRDHRVELAARDDLDARRELAAPTRAARAPSSSRTGRPR